MSDSLLRAILFSNTGNLITRKAVLITKNDTTPLATLQTGDGGLISIRLPLETDDRVFVRLAGSELSDAAEVTEIIVGPEQQPPQAIPPILLGAPEHADDIDELPVEVSFRSDIDYYERPANIAHHKCEPLLPNRAPARRFRYSQILTQPTPVIGVTLAYIPNEPVFSLAAVIDYETLWTPIDQVLGEPVHSLSLAPCEQTRIAVVNWSRDESGVLREGSDVSESLAHELNRDRQIDDVVTATLNEWQSGNSLQGGTAGVLGGSFGMFSFTNSHSGGYASNETRGRRELTAEGRDRLQDSITQAANGARSRYGTVVKDATQNEYQFAQTRVVRNHNHCHMLNVLYHEVLQRFEIRTRFLRARDALIIDFQLRCFEHFFPTSSDHEIEGCDLHITPRELNARREQLIPHLIDPSLADCFDALKRALCLAESIEVRETNDYLDSQLVGELLIVLEMNDHTNFSYISIFAVVGGGIRVALEYVNEEDSEREITPRSLYRVRMKTSRLIAWSDISHFVLVTNTGVTNFELDISILRIETTISGAPWSIIGSPPAFDIVEFEIETSRSGNSSRNNTYAPFPLTPVPNAPVIAVSEEDFCCIRRLIDHLNFNKEYYTAVLVATMSTHERSLILQAIPFNPISIGGEEDVNGSVFDFVVNQPVGVIGSKLVFPLRDITVFSDSLQLERCEDARTTIALSTRGVQAVGQLGDCNLCEEIDPTRFWRWSSEPCPDNATEINPIDVSTRYQNPQLQSAPAAESTLEPADVPAAPAPGSFLDSVFEVLKTPDIFADMSGKEELSKLLQELVKAAADVEKTRLSQAGSSGSGDSESMSNDSAKQGREPTSSAQIQSTRDESNTPEDIVSRARAIRSAVDDEDRADELVEEMVEGSNSRAGGQPPTEPAPTVARAAPGHFVDSSRFGAVDWVALANVFDGDGRLISSVPLLGSGFGQVRISQGASGVVQILTSVTMPRQPSVPGYDLPIVNDRPPGGSGHQVRFEANWRYEPSADSFGIVQSEAGSISQSGAGGSGPGGINAFLEPVFETETTLDPSRPSGSNLTRVILEVQLVRDGSIQFQRNFQARIFVAPDD